MSARVLVVANDHVGTRMAGPGIRSLRFATELATGHDVTLVVPFATDLTDERITIVQDDPWDAHRMNERVRGFDVVVAQKLPVPTMRRLAKGETVAIYDLYAPVTIEALAFGRHNEKSRRLVASHRLNAVTQEVTLVCGDAFVCASERQRDLWLGALLALGRIDQSIYDGDPSLRDMIDVVPFGIDVQPPTSAKPVLKGALPGIGPDDKVLLWGGGIWNWFDPLTIIRAVDRLAKHRADVRLYFLGLRHPNPGVPTMEMERQAVALADELCLTDRFVFFNEGWVPYDQRGAYYLEADIGVSAHFDDLETRFAFRTRLLDCFWAGLPVATTAGDALGELVQSRGLGRTVGVGDVHAWVAAISQLLEDDAELIAIGERLVTVREEFAWPRAVQPLRRLVGSAGKLRARVSTETAVRYAAARMENAVRQHGLRDSFARAARTVTGRTQALEQRMRPPLR
jgi:glycosyltransferase involved in cell wall biosynthesis